MQSSSLPSAHFAYQRLDFYFQKILITASQSVKRSVELANFKPTPFRVGFFIHIFNLQSGGIIDL
jgi:hypothetical protein